MRIYLGGPFETRETLKTMRLYLQARQNDKLHVTSRWLDNEFPSNDSPTQEQKYELCSWNLFDILQSDLVVIFDPKEFWEKGTPGRHIELGYAMASRLPIVLIGERRTIMHHDPLIRVVAEDSKLSDIKEEIERTYTEHWNR